MADIIVLGIVLLIIGAAVAYIIKAKKAGAKCIGCPAGCKCSADGHSPCSCTSQTDEK